MKSAILQTRKIVVTSRTCRRAALKRHASSSCPPPPRLTCVCVQLLASIDLYEAKITGEEERQQEARAKAAAFTSALEAGRPPRAPCSRFAFILHCIIHVSQRSRRASARTWRGTRRRASCHVICTTLLE